jgi:hypothetical protein
MTSIESCLRVVGERALRKTGMHTRFFQASACADGDACQGLFGDRDSEPSFRLQAALDPAQKRTAADEDEPSLHIRRQPRGCALERRSGASVRRSFS